MPPLRVLAVDDEPLALRRVEIAVSDMPDVTLVGRARSGAEGLALVQALKPDVVLLDIQMSNLDGFELIERLADEGAPLVVFVTAHEAFAVRAFEVGAVDYVLKPLELERLRAALVRARRALSAEDAALRAAELRSLVRALREEAANTEPAYATGFWVERRGEHVRAQAHHIDWMEADRDYVRLHTRDGPCLMRGPLATVQEQLDPAQFIRIRRSALVRTDRIKSIRNRGYGDFRIQMSSGEELRVGKTYLRDVRRLLEQR
ncbi:LytTR family DNA-binding domain-containing protein [Phenylobacterium sp.]|uniref:LytR/AlgR family response regulator transcription factor n=1 Tax=Phenylobacterium sp. TaxID=1871053 RepID=UPI0025CEB38B|nr:LytTR family DNA-binding domain-containing protein [Phenylobacterium sp.]